MKERAKSLSVFGGLVSPKLRGAQLSFETGNMITTSIVTYKKFKLTAEILFFFCQLLKLLWK